jgi:hypothetical protein
MTQGGVTDGIAAATKLEAQPVSSSVVEHKMYDLCQGQQDSSERLSTGKSSYAFGHTFRAISTGTSVVMSKVDRSSKGRQYDGSEEQVAVTIRVVEPSL